MNSFFIRRLIPFFISYVLIELAAATYLVVSNADNVNWHFSETIQNIGILQLTSLVSFFLMVLPYVLYITLLPKKYQNQRIDKNITYFLFTAFWFSNVLENISASIFGNEFNILKNLKPSEYLIQAQKILLEIYQEYPLLNLLGIVLLISLIATYVMRGLLFTKLEEPSIGRRLFHFLLYIAVCILALMNIDVEKLKNSNNTYNTLIYEDKTYSILNSFIKKNSRLMILRNYPNRNNKMEQQNDNQ